jgi:hypothetical protein
MQVECLEILFLCLVSSRVCYLLVFDLGGCGFIYLGEKFVLDMQFVVQLATHERCASRLMCSVVSELTSRAVNAYASTGADPDRSAIDPLYQSPRLLYQCCWFSHYWNKSALSTLHCIGLCTELVKTCFSTLA